MIKISCNIFLFLIFITSCISKKNIIFTIDYLPIKAGDTLIYHSSWDDKIDRDTLIVTTLKIKKRTSYLHSRPQNITGTKLLYTPNHFGPGLYYYDRKGNLLTAFVHDKFDFDSINSKNFEILFPKKLYVGYSKTLINPRKTKHTTYKVVGIEDVKVLSATENNCIKIQIEEFWPKQGITYTAFVWLQKNKGVVKWIRTTKRMEELYYKSK